MHRKYDKTGSRTILDTFLQTLLVEKRTERAGCAFMHNKISDALEDNENFWKELRKLARLLTVDDAFHGFAPDKLNTHFLSISVSSMEDLIESFNSVSTSSTDVFSFKPLTANDVILAVSNFKARGGDDIPHLIVAL